jgi:hypothetical protein
MTARTPMLNRVTSHAVRRDEPDDDGESHPGERKVKVSLAAVPWLSRRLPWWDDAEAFAAALAERRRPAGKTGRRKLAVPL